MKVCLVNDTSANPNWGCRATTAALRRLIRDARGEIVSTISITAMGRKERFVPAVPLAAGAGQEVQDRRRRLVEIWPRWAAGRDATPESVEEFDWLAKLACAGRIMREEIAGMEQADVVLINGEGSIYWRRQMGRKMLFLAYLSRRYLNKPTALVNHTADLSDPIMYGMAEMVYPLLDDVVFREPISYRECRALVKDSSDCLAADAAFIELPADKETVDRIASRSGYYSVFPDDAEGFDPRVPYVCVAGSSLYLRPETEAYDPIPGLERLCLALRERVGQVLLMAACGPDEKALRAIASRLNMPLIGLNTPVWQVRDILGNARALVSGRWHPSILALTGGTPFVGFTANTHKIEGLVELAGLGTSVFDAFHLESEAEDIAEVACWYISAGEQLRQEIRDRCTELRASTARNLRILGARAHGLTPNVSLLPSCACAPFAANPSLRVSPPADYAVAAVEAEAQLVAVQGALNAAMQTAEDLSAEVAKSEAQLNLARERLGALERDLAESRQRITALELRVAEYDRRLAESARHLADAEVRADEAERRAADFERRLAAIPPPLPIRLAHRAHRVYNRIRYGTPEPDRSER